MAYQLTNLFLILVGVCLTVSFPLEPQSWFSLVEQLLEKMVRMELNVQAMHKEMTQARDQVTSGLNDVVSMKQTVGALQTYFTDNMNKSEAYDSGAGIFTAPVSGVYFFSAHFCLYNTRAWYYAFMKENDVVVVKGYKYDGQAYVCETASAVVLLLQNERLWIECRSGSTDDLFLSDSYRRSSFSGALLHRVIGYP
ncbi:COAA1-like protein [Mya arenaria]|uniref:COAA1-like protein n=1 Tax=Mya arenaria TaxID=6604 RepID=A0ABY7FVJ6_MYAAR|nr:COAA1-like protein [Mya arenaria]